MSEHEELRHAREAFNNAGKEVRMAQHYLDVAYENLVDAAEGYGRAVVIHGVEA